MERDHAAWKIERLDEIESLRNRKRDTERAEKIEPSEAEQHANLVCATQDSLAFLLNKGKLSLVPPKEKTFIWA
ncbi:hypothetical protein NDU88_002365 [Pleurodeles waltl]|uniref:Uncharacterized protein n=1 Tax=Pleurodeles waltl TaxID=8319 RepID=A0AAV7Q5R7_PLEWA|nr:hypothetical protein NDU88_002365 [Pleurodeles waltl]